MQNPFFVPQLYTTHKSLTGQGTNRGLSPNIWSRLMGGNLSQDSLLTGYFAGDDFLTFGDTYAVASNLGRYASGGGCYRTYEDTGDSVAMVVDEVGGVVELLTDTTDNDEVWMQPGNLTTVLGKISDTAGADKMMLFEARIKASHVTNTLNWFVGMSEEGLAAADTVSDAGALADKDFIGFWVLEADGDALKFGYNKAGAGGVTTLATYGTALSADTYIKVGFAYDPSPHIKPAKRISFYVDNVEQTTYATDTLIAAATFPDAEELNMLVGVKNGSAAAKSVSLDWWAFYQQG
jgi:hypothetical protein